MHTYRRMFAAVAVLSVIALALAACGGGNGGSDTGGNGGGGGGDGTITIETPAGFEFDPAEITVTQGQPVTIILENTDPSQDHNLQIDAFDVDQNVAAGETVEVSFTPDQTGEFDFICNVPGHAEAGMVGTLIVTE